MGTNLESLTDEALAALAQQDNPEALEILIRKYLSVVKGKRRTFFIMGAEEDDVVQEGTIGLLKAIRGYSPGRESSSASRKKHSPLNTSLSLNAPVEENSEQVLGDMLSSGKTVDPETLVILEELMDYISRNEEKKFSPMEVRVWRLYIQGKSYSEIAVLLGKTPKSIYNAMERAKKKILAYLAD
jgi:RNA polymerase sporulation-specific sigma factor